MINSKWIFVFFVATLTISAGCHGQKPENPIAGHITLRDGLRPVVYLVQPRSLGEVAANFSGVIVDSAQIGPDGRFAFSTIKAEMPTLFQLTLQRADSRFANRLNDARPDSANYMPVVWRPGETILIDAVSDRFQASFSIREPSPDNAALLDLRNLRVQSWQAQSSYLGGAEDHADTALIERERALRDYRAPLMAFAGQTTSFHAAMVALRWVSPENDYERVPEFLHTQCEKWSAAPKGHPWANQLCQLGAKDKLPVLAGDLFPEADMPMLNGDTVAFRTLLGARLTLLDVWASWCMPCRRENREVMAPLWQAYKDKGFQIVGYSIDSSPGAWKAAILKDGAAWPHASHLQGDAAPLLETLRITTIPANYLIDAQGRIVAKNLHGEELKRWVEEYMK